jgi:hypothetical protein
VSSCLCRDDSGNWNPHSTPRPTHIPSSYFTMCAVRPVDWEPGASCGFTAVRRSKQCLGCKHLHRVGLGARLPAQKPQQCIISLSSWMNSSCHQQPSAMAGRTGTHKRAHSAPSGWHARLPALTRLPLPPSSLSLLYTGGLTRTTTRATWAVSGRSPLPALPTPRASYWRRCEYFRLVCAPEDALIYRVSSSFRGVTKVRGCIFSLPATPHFLSSCTSTHAVALRPSSPTPLSESAPVCSWSRTARRLQLSCPWMDAWTSWRRTWVQLLTIGWVVPAHGLVWYVAAYSVLTEAGCAENRGAAVEQLHMEMPHGNAHSTTPQACIYARAVCW